MTQSTRITQQTNGWIPLRGEETDFWPHFHQSARTRFSELEELCRNVCHTKVDECMQSDAEFAEVSCFDVLE